MVSGTIQASALTGGPNSDGIHEVTITVSKPGSLDVTTQFTWTVLVSLSINDALKNNLSIYPNPAKNELFIKTKGVLASSIKSIKIHSIDGKLVKDLNTIETLNGKISVDISNLNSSLYFMTVTSEEIGQATYKILVKQ